LAADQGFGSESDGSGEGIGSGPRPWIDSRLLTRNGIDWTGRFPLIAQAAGALQVRSFLIDGEAVACDEKGSR
jgi:hypothetical protein